MKDLWKNEQKEKLVKYLVIDDYAKKQAIKEAKIKMKTLSKLQKIKISIISWMITIKNIPLIFKILWQMKKK